MPKKQTLLTDEENTLIEVLRKQPELRERIKAILAISSPQETQQGWLMKADQVESLLIEEVRKLGQAGLSQWAKAAEERIAREHLEANPGSYCGKKNA